MFGSHKTQGREAGLATRNSFGAVSLGTSLFGFDKGFQPTHEFLRHPYVLAFSTTTIALMMNMAFKSQGWSPAMKDEFIQAAMHEFSCNDPDYNKGGWFLLMSQASTAAGFAEGKEHAEANFFATAELISPTNADPLVVKAREAARNLPPPSDLAAGMLRVTVRKFLHATFPK